MKVHCKCLLRVFGCASLLIGLSGCAPRSASNDVRSSQPKDATFWAHLSSLPKLGEGKCAYFVGLLGWSDKHGRTFRENSEDQMCRILDPVGLDPATLSRCNEAYLESMEFPVVIKAEIVALRHSGTEEAGIMGSLRVDEAWFQQSPLHGAPFSPAELAQYQRTLAEAFPGIPTSLGIWLDGGHPSVRELEEGSPILVIGDTRILSRKIGWVELPERGYLAPFTFAISGDLLRGLADGGHKEPTPALVWGNIRLAQDEHGNPVRSINANRIAFESASRD